MRQMACNSLSLNYQADQLTAEGEEVSSTPSHDTPPSNEVQPGLDHDSPPVDEFRHCSLQNVGSDLTGTERQDGISALKGGAGAEAVQVRTSSFDLGDDRSVLSVPERMAPSRVSHDGATSSQRSTEWVPLMLRKRSATILAFSLWTYAIALQGVDLKVRSIQGISSEEHGAADALRYIPTVTAILLGFGWKALVSDLKKITPWAAMSNDWAPANESLLLNYIDHIDIKSAYVAARFRHWPLFLVLLGGLLSGALVPLANALSYIDLRASVRREVTLQQRTTFSLNGTLAMPVDYRSTLPQGAYTNQLIAVGDVDGNSATWTYGTHAFESFEHPQYGPETIIRTEVMAFTSSLNCEKLNYTSAYDNDGPNSTITIQADRSYRNMAGCLGDIVQMVKQPYNTSTVTSFYQRTIGLEFYADSVPPTAWLNITQCSESHDYRILVNVMTSNLSVTGSANTTLPADVRVSAAGLICEPQYYLVPATVNINATTAKVIDFNATEGKKTSVDIGTSTLIMQAQLQSPFLRESRQVFQAAATNQWSSAVIPNSYDWAVFPQLEVMQKWSWLYLWCVSETAVPATDPFFYNLVGVNSTRVVHYVNDTDLLYNDVNEDFGRKVAQIANLFARRPEIGYLDAIGSFQSSRIFIRELSLRVIQAIVVLLGCLTFLCATFIRPKTCLIEDPGSIASTSVLLSANPKFESFISSNRLQNDNVSRDSLSNVLCRLQQPTTPMPKLEFTHQQRGEDAMSSSIDGNDLQNTSEQPLMLTPSANRIKVSPRQRPGPSDVSREIIPESRYRPIALRIYSRAALSFCVIGMVVALAALLAVSKTSNGFQAATSSSRAAWSYVPTVILVLVGYGIQSLETSVSTLEKYWTLANNEQPGRNIVLPQRVPIKARLFPVHKLSLALLTALTVSSTVYLALKIVAAGLYKQSFSPKESHVVLDIDITPIMWFDDFYNRVVPPNPFGWGFIHAEYASRDMQPQFNNPQAENVIGDLITPFLSQNLTDYLEDNAPRDYFASKITMESFAVHTNVTCTRFDQPEFALNIDCQGNSTYNFTFDCASQVCHQNFDNLLSHINISFVHDHTQQEPADVFYMAASPDRKDASLAILLADFSNLIGSHPEMSSFCSGIEPRNLTSTDLGSSYPTIRGVNCVRIMNRVNVTTTMQPVPSGVALLDQESQTDWWTTGYDENSLKISSTVNPSPWPLVLLPNKGEPIAHRGSTISPPSNFFNTLGLIAQAQSIATGNQEDLLDVTNLVTSAQKVYAMETRHVLIPILSSMQLKFIPGVPLDHFPPKTTMKTAATVTTYQQRVFQDTGTSIALTSLLAVVFACVVVMSTTVPRKSILPTAPSSIAAQMSFVAGSALVERLRKENAVTTKDSRVWDEIFGIGWWPQRSTGEGRSVRWSNGNQMRWGIDMGLLPDRNHLLPHQGPRAPSPAPLESDYIPLDLGDMGRFENPFPNGMEQ